MLCVAFAMGCVAGWGFAMKLMSTRINDLKEACEKRDRDQMARIDAMDKRLRELDDFLLHGMERQLAANREATVRVLGDLGGSTKMGGTP